MRTVISCIFISFVVTALGLIPVYLTARHEENQVIAAMKDEVVELYSVPSVDELDQATGLTEWRQRKQRSDDSVLEIDSETDEVPARPRRIRQKLFDGSRMQAIGKGLFWLAGGIFSVALSVIFVLARIKGASK